MTIDQLQEARGLPVYDSTGEKIGEVEEIFYDEPTNEPVWIGIGTGFFGTKRVLVPVQGAQLETDRLTVQYDKDKVKDSPDIDSDEISLETEDELYAYYGLSSPQPASYTGEGAREGTVTRSEEEMLVGTRDVKAGHARLRKWVETEPVSLDVELQHETARVVREPVNEPTDAEIAAEEVEVGLRAEEPVVAKQTVAKERIGLEKDVETTHETVGGEVRKERVEVEGDTLDR